MKRDEILNSPVYFYSTMQSPKGVRWTFRDVYIYVQSQVCAEYSSLAAQYIIENNGGVTKTEGYEYIKSKIAPAVVFGECRNGSRKLENMTNKGLMVIEVDKIPFSDVEAVKDILYELPYIAYCQTSLSGHGVWALAAVDPAKDFDTMFVNMMNEANKHLLYNALEGKIARYKVDDNATKINRMRVLSFDPARKPIKEEVEVFDDDRAIQTKNAPLAERLAKKNSEARKNEKRNFDGTFRLVYEGNYRHLNNTERMKFCTSIYAISRLGDYVDIIPDEIIEDYLRSMPASVNHRNHDAEFYIKEYRASKWSGVDKISWNLLKEIGYKSVKIK